VAVSLAVLTFVGLRDRGEPPSRPEHEADDDDRSPVGSPRFEPADA
jgi:hypothetical protein